jgi:hypothetical protein
MVVRGAWKKYITRDIRLVSGKSQMVLKSRTMPHPNGKIASSIKMNAAT